MIVVQVWGKYMIIRYLDFQAGDGPLRTAWLQKQSFLGARPILFKAEESALCADKGPGGPFQKVLGIDFG